MIVITTGTLVVVITVACVVSIAACWLLSADKDHILDNQLNLTAENKALSDRVRTLENYVFVLENRVVALENGRRKKV